MPDLQVPATDHAHPAGSCSVASGGATAAAEAKEPARGAKGPWWRRVVRPLRGLLTQGISPERIAATLATGTVCTLCPIFGTTTLLNIAAGVWLRMNHAILQALNQLLGPLQLVMIVVYVRFGSWVFGGGNRDEFSLHEVKRAFQEAPFTELVEKFGLAGWYGFLAWIVTAPVLFGVVYAPARAIARRVTAAKRARGACG